MKYLKQLGNFKRSVSQHHSLEGWVVYELSNYTKTWSRRVSATQFSSKGICVAKEFIHFVLQLPSSLTVLDLALTG